MIGDGSPGQAFLDDGFTDDVMRTQDILNIDRSARLDRDSGQ